MERQDNPLLFWVGDQFLGSCPSVKPLVDRIRGLPNLADWSPEGQEIDVWKVLVLGMILGRIDDESFQPLLLSISKSLRHDCTIKRDEEAELIAAAIIRPWCDRVAYVRRLAGGRSPDLIAMLAEENIEIEVTTACRKSEQEERALFASKLQQRLCAIPLDRHIDVHFLDSLTEDEVQNILAAASQLAIGQSAEVERRWHISILQPNPPGFFAVGNACPPKWFPNQHATPAGMTTFVSTAIAKHEPTASAQARWGLSTKSYLNPLSKKADRDQASNRVPFVIAMDITQLPGAERWCEESLLGYWELWPQVSGVLLFFGPARMGNGLSLTYTLLINPHSQYALPKTWSGGKWEEQLM